MSAASELREYLNEGEEVEAIVFGAWGWGQDPEPGKSWESGYAEPEPPPVPYDKRGVVLTMAEAEPMMQSWDFYGGFGAPECYAVNVWTNQRVIWVTQYDGSTTLSSAMRHPVAYFPDMPGG